MANEERFKLDFLNLIVDLKAEGNLPNYESTDKLMLELVVSYTNQVRQEKLEEVIIILDEKWNCNCVTDESLNRTKCECVESPAYVIRKLMEDVNDD